MSRWVPYYCDITAFYADLENSGIEYQKGRLDVEYYREVIIRASDAPTFEEILVAWGF